MPDVPYNHHIRGNVLFLVLIAATLFAALSYVVVHSSRSGGGGMKQYDMQNALDVTLNHVVSLRQSLQRMSIGGIPVSSLNARFPLSGGASCVAGEYPHDNPSCPIAGVNDVCKIYHPQGGSVVFFSFAERYPDFAAATDCTASYLGKSYWGEGGEMGTDAEDLIYSIKVTKEFCDFINKKLGVALVDDYVGDGSTATPTVLDVFTPLDGSVSPSNAGLGGNTHATLLQGHEAGCWNSAAAGGYVFSSLILLK